MRAAVYRRFGGPDTVRVEEVPRPTVGPDDVLIRVHASTVSAADHRARSRECPADSACSPRPGSGCCGPRAACWGMDAAGVVEAVGGNVTRFVPGDAVIAMLDAAFGGHAEYARIRADGVLAHKPRNTSFDEP